MSLNEKECFIASLYCNLVDQAVGHLADSSRQFSNDAKKA